MNIKELRKTLKELNIDIYSYSLDGNFKPNALAIIYQNKQWRVIYMDEKGGTRVEFSSENESITCNYLLKELIEMQDGGKEEEKQQLRIDSPWKELTVSMLEDKLQELGVKIMKDSSILRFEVNSEKLMLCKERNQWKVFQRFPNGRDVLIKTNENEDFICGFILNFSLGRMGLLDKLQ